MTCTDITDLSTEYYKKSLQQKAVNVLFFKNDIMIIFQQMEAKYLEEEVSLLNHTKAPIGH